MSNLYNIATALHSGHPVTKPLKYYEKYDNFLNHHNIFPENILEIGTFQGESTKILSAAFPSSKILSLDITVRRIDFSDYKNVTYEKADQTNQTQLTTIINKHFPQGVDLVIDDASHVGYFSQITFNTVFPLLKERGAYFIEDWGTGYWDDWPDGGRFQTFSQRPHDNNIPQRIPSHDFGMVGFVKQLVDLTHEGAIKTNQADESKYVSRIDVLEFGEGVVMLIKSSANQR